MKFITLIVIITFNTILHSQSQTGLVQYGHKQSMGMGAPIGIDYNANLIFDNENSLYTFAKDSLEGGHIRESVYIEKDKDNFFVNSKITNKLGFQYYVDKENKKLLSRDIGFNYVKEEIPTINWEISDEKKDIGSFECLKASTEFRGRTYTAWFTTSIPLPYGPWKLQGLPGLILEAYDTNKEIYFYFKSIKYPMDSKIKIQKPNSESENKEWITFSEYKKTLINKHKKAIENGRMLIEGFDSADTAEDKYTMGNSYIEIFDNE
ncbi:GLPGLI family protein [Subsaximicrobium wynnwilliamsii]|nr:GLPGLI family protein [Subsaximicrobium wynnwilliamsii]